MNHLPAYHPYSDESPTLAECQEDEARFGRIPTRRVHPHEWRFVDEVTG